MKYLIPLLLALLLSPLPTPAAEPAATEKKVDYSIHAGVYCLWSLYAELKNSIEKCPAGPSVKRNDEDAYFWFSLVPLGPNHNEAIAERAEVAKRLSPEKIAAIEKRAKEWKPTGNGDGAAEFEHGAQLQHQDDLAAEQWYKKAADKGYAIAQFSLAQLYAEGGGDVDDKEIDGRLTDALDRLDKFIIANSTKPVTLAKLKEREKNQGLSYGCMANETARRMINQIKYEPPEEFKKALDDFLSTPRVPSMNPCF